MSCLSPIGSAVARRGRLWPVAALAAAVFALAGPARADDSASTILKSMSQYIGKQKQIAADFDSTIEIVTPEMQKIQFASSGSVQLSRPDKLHITRTGGYTDLELVFDGAQLSILAKNTNILAQTKFSGSVDAMIDTLYEKFDAALPGMDLLLSDSERQLTTDVISSAHIGRGVIDGVECEHLAFRGTDIDWQLWIELGDKPLPRKYVITSKGVIGAPQYSLTLRNWKTDAPIADNVFAVKEPQGVKKVALESFADFDEVPTGTVGRSSK
jgi:hypothetical protein